MIVTSALHDHGDVKRTIFSDNFTISHIYCSFIYCDYIEVWFNFKL